MNPCKIRPRKEGTPLPPSEPEQFLQGRRRHRALSGPVGPRLLASRGVGCGAQNEQSLGWTGWQPGWKDAARWGAQGFKCHTAGCLSFLNSKSREIPLRELHQGLRLILKILSSSPCPLFPNPSSGIREEVRDLLPWACPHPCLTHGRACLSPLPGRCRCGWAALISGPLEPPLSL